MDLLLAHIPHLALLLGVGLLFVQMMVGEKRMQLALADGGEQAAEQVTVLTVRSAVRMLLMLLFLAAVVVMGVEVLRDELPSAFVVVDYLLAGGVLAIWMAWQAPSALAPGVQARMGASGRALVRMAVGIVTVGVLVIAGMAMAHGVVLPPL
ncbi:MAG: hypothetical protein ISP32_00530 [Thermoleophilia bacterium]|nr:hypothetical protein [Thermoleophilia bacterium]